MGFGVIRHVDAECQVFREIEHTQPLSAGEREGDGLRVPFIPVGSGGGHVGVIGPLTVNAVARGFGFAEYHSIAEDGLKGDSQDKPCQCDRRQQAVCEEQDADADVHGDDPGEFEYAGIVIRTQ